MRMCAGRWKGYKAMQSYEIGSYILHFSYAGIFLWFALVEQVTPIPEEVSLVTLGYVANHSGLNPWVAGAMSVLGLATADGLFYILSRRGSRLMASFLAKLNAGFLDRIRVRFQDHPVGTVLFMAMLPKLRFLSPVIAGTLRIPVKRFFPANLFVTVFYAVLYMLLGFFFHDRIHQLVQDVESARHLVFAVLMLLVAVYFVSRSRTPLDR